VCLSRNLNKIFAVTDQSMQISAELKRLTSNITCHRVTHA